MPTSPLHVVVLAAGQGKRMRSDRPKVLHRIAGRALLEYVVDAARALDPARVHVVYGHAGGRVREALADLDVEWVEQREQLGTGHAVDQAMPGVPDDATVLVLYGDVPLVDPATLAETVAHARADALAMITVELDDPTGYGRIVRDADGAITGIVEHNDANAGELAINEINTGIVAAPAGRLRAWLATLENDNAQGEFYLTDCVARAVADGVAVRAAQPATLEEVLGVNDRIQLAHLERHWQRAQTERLMRDGATLADPARVDVRGEVSVGSDVFIDVNVILEGRVTIADGATIGPGCVIADAEIGPGTEIRPYCVIERTTIGARCLVGPFARLRPGADLADEVHVGNFVEVKNASLGEGSKANHLTYLGDAEIGRGVNVGAGTITCNYDGANKHRTVIGDDVFVGSGAMLVAPITVHAGATIGAGSTVSREAPAGKLTLERAKQRTVEGWQRPVKKPK